MSSVNFDNLHAVKEWGGNRVDAVGGGNEHDAAEVEGQFEIVVAECAVLLAVKHLQHGAGRVAAEIMAHLVDFVEQEYRVHRASLLHAGDNPPRNRANIISAELEDEIAGLFLSTGMVYHRPNRIAPSMKHEESHCNIVFQRGIGLDSISCVSGIGFYSKLECISNPDGIKTMFGLEQQAL